MTDKKMRPEDFRDEVAEDVIEIEGDKTEELVSKGKTRRDFLVLLGNSLLAVPIAATGYTALKYMAPSEDQLAIASSEANISSLKTGETVTVSWRGKPVFIRKRTETQLEEIRAVPLSELRDPQTDADRVKKKYQDILVVVGICTHLGCIPGTVDAQGDYGGGWFCPCHGSHYDASGRIRKGPAPLNLLVPPYKYSEDGKTIFIGEA